MNIEDIVTEVEAQWTCQEGLVTLRPANRYDCLNNQHDGDENQILWTAHFYFLLYQLNYFIDHPDQYFYYKNQVTKALDKLKVSKGIYNRHIGFVQDGTSWDEYVGLTILSSIFNLGISKDICEVGMKNGWVFNNVDSGNVFAIKRAVEDGWRGDVQNYWDIRQTRQGKEVAWYKLFAKFKPTIWEEIWRVGSIVSTSYREKGSTSGRLLAWMRLEMLKSRSDYHKLVHDLYMFKLRKMYNSIRRMEVNGTWVSWKENEHPVKKLYDIYFNINSTIQHHPFLKLIKILVEEIDN